MGISKFKLALIWSVMGLFIVTATFFSEVRAQSPKVDPAAVQFLRDMTEYTGSLKTFSVQTQNIIEDVLISGQRVDQDISARVIIQRPDKLQAKRMGELVDQVFYYNGKTLTLFNPGDNVYATRPAPASIEATLDYTRESLGLVVPAADLIYKNAFDLLMQDVTLAQVIGDSVINGVKCKHLLFSKPGVDFQIWIAQEGKPLPHKYVVTDPAFQVSVSTFMSDWNVTPQVEATQFLFIPPPDAKKIDFLPL